MTLWPGGGPRCELPGSCRWRAALDAVSGRAASYPRYIDILDAGLRSRTDAAPAA